MMVGASQWALPVHQTHSRNTTLWENHPCNFGTTQAPGHGRFSECVYGSLSCSCRLYGATKWGTKPIQCDTKFRDLKRWFKGLQGDNGPSDSRFTLRTQPRWSEPVEGMESSQQTRFQDEEERLSLTKIGLFFSFPLLYHFYYVLYNIQTKYSNYQIVFSLRDTV